MQTLEYKQPKYFDVLIEDNLIFNLITNYVFHTYTDKYIINYCKSMNILNVLFFLKNNPQLDNTLLLSNYVRFYYTQTLLEVY